MKINILKDTSLIFIGALIAFLFVPLFMIGSSPDDYNFIDVELFYKTAILYSIIIGTLFSLVNIVLQLFKLNKISTFIIYFLLTWIIVSGFIFSVSASTGMVDPENNPIKFINVVIVFVVSLMFSIISLTAFKKYIQIFLFIVVITSTLPALISINNSDSLKLSSGDHPSLQLSNKKNILVISFDGMPGEVVSNIIKNNKDYSNDLKDFIIFENAVSQAPATAASLIGDIYGIQDYKTKGNDIFTVRKTLKNEGLLSKITSKHIKDSFQYGYSTEYEMKKMEILSPVVKVQQKSDTFSFFKYPIIRMFTSYGLNTLNWKESVLPFKQYLVKGDTVLEVTEKLKHHNGADWDKKGILTLNLFDSFVSDISVLDKDISLRYLHLTFTHFPVDYDAECNYRSDDKIWYDDNQNEKGIRNQDICAVGKFIGFLGKLKELEIYSNSLIIFKSDHGKPTDFYSKPPYNLKINDHAIWGYSRYRPMLMIKDFEANRQNPTFKSELVLLNDIAKTICEESGADTDCQIFNGVNLLGDSLINDEPYFIYVVKDAKGSFEYDTHISVKIPSRKNTLIQEMKESDLISLSE